MRGLSVIDMKPSPTFACSKDNETGWQEAGESYARRKAFPLAAWQAMSADREKTP